VMNRQEGPRSRSEGRGGLLPGLGIRPVCVDSPRSFRKRTILLQIARERSVLAVCFSSDRPRDLGAASKPPPTLHETRSKEGGLPMGSDASRLRLTATIPFKLIAKRLHNEG